MSLLWLGMGWALFGALHSALISGKVVAYVTSRFGDKARYYRIIYNAISGVTLIILLLYESYLSQDMTEWCQSWWPLRVALFVTGVVFFIAGGREYDIGEFLGIAQIRSGRLTKTLSQESRMLTGGILAWVRHPWYIGAFCLVHAGPWNAASVTSHCVLSLYLVVGTLLEERRLVRTLGEPYRRYQKEVPMFIPWKIAFAWSVKGRQ